MKTLVCFAVVLATASAYNMGRSGGGGGQYDLIYDSQRDGLNHPYVVYDSKRDGYNAARANQFANDPSLTTIFDSKRDGWNHPYVVSNTRSSGGSSSRSSGGYMAGGQRRAAAPVPQMRSMQMQQQQPRMQMQMQQPRSQQQAPRGSGRPTTYDNYEVIFDSKRDGWNHPWVVYDSKRDGLDSPLRYKYDNDPNLVTIFDSKVDGWNHPYVIYDSRRDGPQRRF